jgi:hypothetical protein
MEILYNEFYENNKIIMEINKTWQKSRNRYNQYTKIIGGYYVYKFCG